MSQANGMEVRCHVCETRFIALPPSDSTNVFQVNCPACTAANQLTYHIIENSNPIAVQSYAVPTAYPVTAYPVTAYPTSPDSVVLSQRPSGRRKAVLIGINYYGTSGQLNGCINDVSNMESLLTGIYGWSTSCIRKYTDDGRNQSPTRNNIMQALNWLADGAQPGDVLFFHYSGHGSQQEDIHGYEDDGMNETILPC